MILSTRSILSYNLTMNKMQKQYIDNPEKYKQIVWDYDIEAKTFFELLDGKIRKPWLDRDWATARVLENINYYDAMSLIDITYLKLNWNNIKQKIYNTNIQNGYEYLLQRRTIPSTR